MFWDLVPGGSCRTWSVWWCCWVVEGLPVGTTCAQVWPWYPLSVSDDLGFPRSVSCLELILHLSILSLSSFKCAEGRTRLVWKEAVPPLAYQWCPWLFLTSNPTGSCFWLIPLDKATPCYLCSIEVYSAWTFPFVLKRVQICVCWTVCISSKLGPKNSISSNCMSAV